MVDLQQLAVYVLQISSGADEARWCHQGTHRTEGHVDDDSGVT